MAKTISKFLDIKVKLYKVDNGFLVYFNDEIHACNTAFEPVSDTVKRLTADFIMNSNNDTFINDEDYNF
jgi:hypothetical protein